MKLFKFSITNPHDSRDYLYIGHNPSPNNPVYLWAMSSSGEILKDKAVDGNTYHRACTIPYDFIMKAIAIGRYDGSTNMCSISYNKKCEKLNISSTWVKLLLNTAFPNAKFVEFGKQYCYSLQNTAEIVQG